LIACGVAPSPTPTVSGTIRDFFMPDAPVAGIAVASGGVRAVTGSDRAFTLAGVTTPYNVVAISGLSGVSESGAALFTGYYQTGLAQTRLGASPIEAGFMPLSEATTHAPGDTIGPLSTTRHLAEIQGSGSAAPGANVKVVVSDGQRNFWTTVDSVDLGIDGSFAFELWMIWPGGPTHEVMIGAYQLDADGDLRFARVPGTITVERNQVKTGVEIPELMVLAESTDTTEVEVTVHAPVGHLFSGGGVAAVMMVDGIFMEPFPPAQGSLPADVFTSIVYLTVFEVPDALYGLSVRFDLKDTGSGEPAGSGFATRPYTSLPAGAVFDLLEPPVLGGPDGVETDLDPQFTFTPTPEATAHTVIMQCGGEYLTPQWWIVQGSATAGSLRLPLNPGINATLNPGSECGWSVLATGDRTTSPDRGFLTAFSLLELGDPRLMAHFDLPYLLDEPLTAIMAPEFLEFTVAE
jgi:hypothetical protein